MDQHIPNIISLLETTMLRTTRHVTTLVRHYSVNVSKKRFESLDHDAKLSSPVVDLKKESFRQNLDKTRFAGKISYPRFTPRTSTSIGFTRHLRQFSSSPIRDVEQKTEYSNNETDKIDKIAFNDRTDSAECDDKFRKGSELYHHILNERKKRNEDALQQYVYKVGTTTGKLLGVTALSGASIIGTGFALMSVGVSSDILMTLGGTAWFGAFIGSFYHAYQLGDTEKSDEQRLRNAYWMQGLMGVTISPSLLIFHQFIPHALITTGALVAGPITASRMMSDGAMLKWGPALYTGLWGLVGVGVTSIVAPMLGFHEMGTALHNIDLYGGVVLFTVYNAYDTHVMIDEFKRGNRDYVGHAANYSLNAVNIFIRLLEIFARANEKK